MKKEALRRTQEDRTRATATALLDAAETLFGRDGYAATGLDDIAARAGLTKGALYHHFPEGKAAIFEAVVLKIQRDMKRAMDDAAKGVKDIDGMKHVLGVYFSIASQPHVHRITLLDAPAVLGPEKWRDIEKRHALKHVRDSVELVLGPTQASELVKSMLAQAFYGAAYEATFAVVNAPDRAAAIALAVDTIAAIVEGAYTVMLRQAAETSPTLRRAKSAPKRPVRRE